MVECEICLEEYQEGDQERHWEMCVPRLMFRCTLCNGDYVSKEGLWNHLDLHEISDENKESHYQEVKEKHKLHQCVLCNDQRAYSEGSYWKHVHDDHNGFILRCADCGECFQSEKLKNDHGSNRCKARDDTVSSDGNVLEIMTSSAQPVELSLEGQSSNANELLNDRLGSEYAENDIIGKESELPSVNLTTRKDLPTRFICDICGQSFPKKGFLFRHKQAKFSCSKILQQKCPRCRGKFRKEELQAHFSSCEKQIFTFACELCPMKFKTSAPLSTHKRNVHGQKGGLRKLNGTMGKAVHLAGKTTNHSGPSDSSSNSDVAADRDISTVCMDIGDKGVQQLVNNPSSISLGTKCSHCGKECASDYNRRQHILKMHQPIKCSICGFTSEGTGRARFHKIKEHKNLRYECANCTRKFFCIKLYKRHLNACNPVQSESSSPSGEASCNKCSHCGVEESSAIDLARHILIHQDPYGCYKCGITLPSLSQIQQHMETIHKTPKIQCPHCAMLFGSSKSLQIHVSYCGNEKIVCDFCGKMFKDVIAVNLHRSKFCHAYKRIKEQEQNNSETSNCDKTGKNSSPLVSSGLSGTKCIYCNKDYSTPEYIIRHLKVSHNLFKCDNCGIAVLGFSALIYHKKKYHYKTKYECLSCGKKFRRKLGYKAHRLECGIFVGRQVNDKKSPMVSTNSTVVPQDENTELKLEIKIEETTLQELENEISTEDPGITSATSLTRNQMKLRYECTNCTRKFYCIELYKRHINACNPVQSTSSSYKSAGELIPKDRSDLKVAAASPSSEASCSEIEGSSAIDLARHILAYHDPVACNLCGSTFSSHSQAQHHVETTHNTLKIKCPHCAMQFTPVSRLQKHESYCKKLKVPCKFCGKMFKDFIAMTIHSSNFCHAYTRIKEQKNAEATQINCGYCNEEFSSPGYFIHHIKISHELTKCDICGIAVLGLSVVKHHEVNCLDKPNHECSTCGEKFRFESGYDAHCLACHGQMIDKESPMVSTLNGKSESQLDSGKTSPSLVENLTNQPNSCNISLFPDVKEIQTNSAIVPRDENIELKLEINLEETMLQELDNNIPNEDPRGTFATTLDPRGGTSKDMEADAAENLENGIKVKEEYLEDEDRLRVPSDRNQSF